MIIIGYQGIGKSTLAGKNGYIDLESGNFWVNGKRDENWYKPYCKIALHLHRQGYTVFLSSHEVVQKYLKEITSRKDWNHIYVCYPESYLKNSWVNKLRERYESSKLDKDYKAWKNAEERFEENINELSHCGFKRIHLDEMSYDLEKEVEAARSRFSRDSLSKIYVAIFNYFGPMSELAAKYSDEYDVEVDDATLIFRDVTGGEVAKLMEQTGLDYNYSYESAEHAWNLE